MTFITHLRVTSPSTAIVPRLDRGAPGHVDVIMMATAWFGWTEKASVTQNATSGSRIYWQPIPTRRHHGRLKWRTSSWCFMLHPETTINNTRITIPDTPRNISMVDLPLCSNDKVSFIEVLLAVELFPFMVKVLIENSACELKPIETYLFLILVIKQWCSMVKWGTRQAICLLACTGTSRYKRNYKMDRCMKPHQRP